LILANPVIAKGGGLLEQQASMLALGIHTFQGESAAQLEIVHHPLGDS
jgi:hypothetical protein